MFLKICRKYIPPSFPGSKFQMKRKFSRILLIDTAYRVTLWRLYRGQKRSLPQPSDFHYNIIQKRTHVTHWKYFFRFSVILPIPQKKSEKYLNFRFKMFNLLRLGRFLSHAKKNKTRRDKKNGISGETRKKAQKA